MGISSWNCSFALRLIQSTIYRQHLSHLSFSATCEYSRDTKQSPSSQTRQLPQSRLSVLSGMTLARTDQQEGGFYYGPILALAEAGSSKLPPAAEPPSCDRATCS
jgi:hypothetical protein